MPIRHLDYNQQRQHLPSLFIYLFFFKLIYIRSIAKQVTLTYINRSRPLIPGEIHFILFERGLRGERSQTCPHMLSAKQGSIWYQFYNVFGMTRSGIEPTTSRSQGERSNHWATSAQYPPYRGIHLYMYLQICKSYIALFKRTNEVNNMWF